MNTYETAARELLELFEQARTEWTEYPLAVDYPNRAVINREDQDLPFIDLQLEYLTGEVMDLAPDKFSRYWGSLVLSVATKEQGGYMQAMRLLQHFTDRMQLKATPRVTIGQAQPTKLRRVPGWEYRPLLFIFYFTRTQSGN